MKEEKHNINNTIPREDLKNFLNKPYYAKGIIYSKGIVSVESLIVPSLFVVPFFLFGIALHSDGFTFYFLVLAIIAINIYALKKNILPIINNLRSKKWRRTTASVHYCSIWRIDIPMRAVEYFPYISYRYILNNKLYKSDRLSFEAYYINNYTLNPKENNNNSPAHNFFEDAVKDKKIVILFNPKNPEESVIIRKIHPLRYLFYMLSSFFHIAFIVVILDFLFTE